jgi:hypothetical protein
VSPAASSSPRTAHSWSMMSTSPLRSAPPRRRSPESSHAGTGRTSPRCRRTPAGFRIAHDRRVLTSGRSVGVDGSPGACPACYRRPTPRSDPRVRQGRGSADETEPARGAPLSPRPPGKTRPGSSSVPGVLIPG